MKFKTLMVRSCLEITLTFVRFWRMLFVVAVCYIPDGMRLSSIHQIKAPFLTPFFKLITLQLLTAGMVMAGTNLFSAEEKINITGLSEPATAAVIYYNDFSDGIGKPKINSAELITKGGALAYNDSGCVLAKGDKFIRLQGPAVKPVNNMTYSCWFKLLTELPPNGGGGLFSIAGGSRNEQFVSLFSRGGPWCGLKDTAAVFQVQNVPGVSAVSDIFDRNFRAAFTAGKWHHVAMTIADGYEIRCYFDGKKVHEVMLNGRTFTNKDVFGIMDVGSYGGKILIDNLMIATITMPDEEIKAYYEKQQQELK